ncbi:MAG: response regulator [Gammaproteobacteria bacterium]|nr:response regulator [Gammaproteobacteria bacterium]MDH5652835.1 response regulator [Gammaproteobacteria bacterium]
MGHISHQEIEQRIAKLRESYLAELPGKLAALNQHWTKLKTSPNDAHISTLHHAVHSLAGSGATFGIEQVSILARSIEQNLKFILDEKRLPTDAEVTSMEELFSQLLNVTGREQAPVTEDFGGITPVLEQQLIYIVDDNDHEVEMLSAALHSVQFQVRSFTDPESFKQAFLQQQPAAVIMDIVFPGNARGGIELIDELRRQSDNMPPVIFISVRGDITARLLAVKAGATRYYTKPIDSRRLIASLNSLTSRLPQHPYRILIVDDDRLLSEYYATLLQGAGMETCIVNEPLQLLASLEEFKPDLILMDVYMPECSGLELAAVIRQDDNYLSLPIVFLSTESNIDKQLHAMDLGGDDFLTKPIIPGHLISAIVVRVKRARRLARLREDLEIALLQNRRQRAELEKKEERLRYSQQFGNIGTWDLDIESNRMIWSERIAPLLGYGNVEEWQNRKPCELFFDAILPEDRERVTHAIENCIAGRHNFDIEHRVIWSDGSIHWLLQRGDVIRDEQNAPIRMLGVVLDITRRKQLERDLATQKDMAEQASRAKSEFLSRMSHELRTPLNAIIGFAQLLESDAELPLHETQQDSMGEILRASNHLLELIDEVLDLSRIEAGKMKLTLEELELVDVLLECYSLMSPIADSRHIQLDFNMQECTGVKVRADQTRLRQIMLNLLSNAIKYNEEFGKVTIQVDAFSLSRIRINVIDTGPGISEQEQNQLFEAFNRLGAETGDVKGTGIGLMITKRLVEMMGGELGVSSQQQQGSRFWLELIRTDTGAENRSVQTGRTVGQNPAEQTEKRATGKK